MIRNVIAIVSGSITGIILLLIARVLLFSQNPFPDNLNWDNPSDRIVYVASLDNNALYLSILSHFISTFLAGLIASLIARQKRILIGYSSAMILLFMIVIYSIGLSYPIWFYIVDILITALGGILGTYVGSRRTV